MVDPGFVVPCNDNDSVLARAQTINDIMFSILTCSLRETQPTSNEFRSLIQLPFFYTHEELGGTRIII